MFLLGYRKGLIVEDIIFNHCLLYANDLKLFRKLGMHNAIYLERYVNSLINWYDVNAMQLNIDKCDAVT